MLCYNSIKKQYRDTKIIKLKKIQQTQINARAPCVMQDTICHTLIIISMKNKTTQKKSHLPFASAFKLTTICPGYTFCVFWRYILR